MFSGWKVHEIWQAYHAKSTASDCGSHALAIVLAAKLDTSDVIASAKDAATIVVLMTVMRDAEKSTVGFGLSRDFDSMTMMMRYGSLSTCGETVDARGLMMVVSIDIVRQSWSDMYICCRSQEAVIMRRFRCSNWMTSVSGHA